MCYSSLLAPRSFSRALYVLFVIGIQGFCVTNVKSKENNQVNQPNLNK